MAHWYEDPVRLESELPPALAAPRVLTPNLVVLLGSTSALAGLELMRHMLTLKPADQRRVALVYIDTDDPPAPLVEFRRQHNNVFLEFPLRIAVPAGISNAARIDESDQHTFIQKRIPQYFANGAGGIRNNGHVAACFNYQYIYDVLDRALVAIGRLGVEQNVSKSMSVQANIVAFLGGGTGSGILTDIAVMVRDVMTYRQYKQRLNLFCMLPEPISGSNLNDLRWRKSNATACLLETIAYSQAAAVEVGAEYRKYMHNRVHRLTNDPLANEVYLVGHSAMNDGGDTARIVGLDLFQRTTNASGVGFLEHSKWIDRRTLGSTDDRGLPTMFGTSCPLEVCLPAEETATAFAQIAASHLLPLFASYQPVSPTVGDNERRDWGKKWGSIARIEATESNPLAVKLTQFRSSDFEGTGQSQLDLLWIKLERYERNMEARIREILGATEREEILRIDEVPAQEFGDTGGVSLLNRRMQYLKTLQQEYTLIFERLNDIEILRVPARPLDLEEKLVKQPQLPGMLRRVMRDYSGALSDAYNERIRKHALATRHRLLEQVLKTLMARVQDAIAQALSWFQSTGVEQRARDLRARGLGSMAWHGKLEYPHPHQRHIFDIRSLRTEDERNIAVERLYTWTTGGDSVLHSQEDIDYQRFIAPCAEYLSRQHASASGNTLNIDRHIANRLAERVVEFFRDYYQRRLISLNLFDVLEKVAPPTYTEQTIDEQVSGYLYEHLEHIQGLTSSLVAFEAELWPEGLSTLDTSLYLGISWRDGTQEALLRETLNRLGALTSSLTPTVNQMYDPHRLQVCYGQHAISLSTVRDFYLEHNSAMEAYLSYQRAWTASAGTGLMPVHSSGEAERLVTSSALGSELPVYERVIRHSSIPK